MEAFHQNFNSFSSFGVKQTGESNITLSQSDKWMKQSSVVDGKPITTTDTAICFKKLKSNKLSLSQYLVFLKDLAAYKKVPYEAIIAKMGCCEAPEVKFKESKSTVVDRLTDTTKYTGAHKQRFDGKGKGKGAEGRRDNPDNDGYVSGYKHKDTYDRQSKYD